MRALAERIAPQLETLLREKLALGATERLAAHFDALWQEVWRETQAALPGLIRAQLGATTRIAVAPAGTTAWSDRLLV